MLCRHQKETAWTCRNVWEKSWLIEGEDQAEERMELAIRNIAKVSPHLRWIRNNVKVEAKIILPSCHIVSNYLDSWNRSVSKSLQYTKIATHSAQVHSQEWGYRVEQSCFDDWPAPKGESGSQGGWNGGQCEFWTCCNSLALRLGNLAVLKVASFSHQTLQGRSLHGGQMFHRWSPVTEVSRNSISRNQVNALWPSKKGAAPPVPASLPLIACVPRLDASLYCKHVNHDYTRRQKSRRTEMCRSVFCGERRKNFIHGTFSNIDQHISIGKALHRSDLVAL